jgi:DNA-binding NarL/FixJ family response regulator
MRLSETKQCLFARFRAASNAAKRYGPCLTGCDQRSGELMRFRPEFSFTGGRSTVFIVETEQVVRSALYYILRDRYRTLAFASAEAATTAAASTPNVVLLGAGLVRRQGKALLASLGNTLGGPKVLLVSETSADPLRRSDSECGVHGVITKPISFDSVCEAVESALSAPVVIRPRFRAAPVVVTLADRSPRPAFAVHERG